MSNNKDTSSHREIFPEGYFDWFGLTIEYLSLANILAKQIQKREGWGTTKSGIAVPLFLFRHGLELAIKTYSILFNIKLKKNHDVREIGKQISKILSTLNTVDLEDADELIELPSNKKGIPFLPKGVVMNLTLQYWEDKLPKIVEKYIEHNYIGDGPYTDPNNILLRYPENPAFLKKLNEMQDYELETILTDMHDQLMLFSLVFSIKMGQPIKK